MEKGKTSIKHSEDMVDASKSKNSYAICDLGLAITTQLVPKDADLQGLSLSVSLPPKLLYKLREKENDIMVSEMKTRLADESVLAHSESPELEMVPSQLAEDDALKDSEKNGKEMTLAEIIKSIKSQGTKRKQVKKNNSVPAETKMAENDIDIINVCTTKDGESDAEDLIGCEIKVWWPMDKQFYEGTVKSYDPLKRKHVILYNDGDVEVLHLGKERWELIDRGRKPSKKLKPSKPLSSGEVSTGTKQRSSSGSGNKKTKRMPDMRGEQGEVEEGVQATSIAERRAKRARIAPHRYREEL